MTDTEFKKWQDKFYHSARWIELRNLIRNRDRMRCRVCGKLIRGTSIVDHVTEITKDNCKDESITMNPDNLQLLCIDCHNSKTFGKRINYSIDGRGDVNLF